MYLSTYTVPTLVINCKIILLHTLYAISNLQIPGSRVPVSVVHFTSTCVNGTGDEKEKAVPFVGRGPW